nr:uncharacterized protein LOC109155081 [Ipomoea batatas]
MCYPKEKGGVGFRRLREMNLSLLGKQAWRLITRPNSLVARVYKSRYYPQGSFFDASSGSNPSYIWRGLLEVREVMGRGCRRCIGDGLSTKIGTDPWLPIDDNPYISSPLHDSIMEAPVSSLLNVQGTGWDVAWLNWFKVGATLLNVSRRNNERFSSNNMSHSVKASPPAASIKVVISSGE